MRRRPSPSIALGIACIAHAAVVAWAVAHPLGRQLTPTTPAPSEIDVAPVDEATEASEPTASLAPPASASNPRAARPSAGSASSSGEAASIGENPPVATTRPEPSSSSRPAWTFSPLALSSTDTLTALTASGARAVASASLARDEATAAREAFRDRGPILTGAAGVLVPLTRDVVRPSRAPLRGDARLAFLIDAAGLVTSVQVVDASSDRVTWEEVAADLAVEARKKTIPVSRATRGIALTLDVTSYLPSPSGVDGTNELKASSPFQERFDTAHAEQAPGTLRGGRSAQPRKLDLVIGPNVIDLTVRQGVGDLIADTTLAPRRVVTVKVVDERAL